MPRRTDLEHVLVIGSGPIVIGQACEFDYSGTQACRVLRAEGLTVSLVNSNPATIMTDPDFAHATYIEPITPDVVAKIIERERPDAVLPTLGGQTGLNTAMALYERGIIGIPGTPEMIGANALATETAEDRDKFKQAMIEIGLKVPESGIAHDMIEEKHREVAARLADYENMPGVEVEVLGNDVPQGKPPVLIAHKESTDARLSVRDEPRMKRLRDKAKGG